MKTASRSREAGANRPRRGLITMLLTIRDQGLFVNGRPSFFLPLPLPLPMGYAGRGRVRARSCEEIAPVVVPAFLIGTRLAGSGLHDLGFLLRSSAPPLLCSPNSRAAVWRVSAAGSQRQLFVHVHVDVHVHDETSVYSQLLRVGVDLANGRWQFLVRGFRVREKNLTRNGHCVNHHFRVG